MTHDRRRIASQGEHGTACTGLTAHQPRKPPQLRGGLPKEKARERRASNVHVERETSTHVQYDGNSGLHGERTFEQSSRRAFRDSVM